MPNLPDLNDSLDDLIGGDRRETPVAAPAAYAATQASYFEPCRKCRGTGQTRWGMCFSCKGQKGKTFKTSPEQRSASKVQRNVRKDRSEQQALDDYKVGYPEIFAWIEAEHLRFPFAADMRACILRYGCLTEKQHAACERMVEKAKARKAERAQADEAAPQADTDGVDRLKAAFDHAIEYARSKGRGRGLKWPKITIGGFTISPAKPESNNPGALYVKDANREYLGKIANGRFFGRNCPLAVETQVLAFIADPKQAAIVYGIKTGTCCICNAELTNEVSIKAGIGPICAEKFGW